MFDLSKILRDNIRVLKPYSAARDEYKGSEGIFLDANENAFGSATQEANNRYPDPLAKEVKTHLGKIKNVDPAKIFLGNGSDEAIDILYRSFCRPGIDKVITTPPTYGMYEVNANINDIHIITVPLTAAFELEAGRVLAAVDANTRMVIICSPNNPTGNCPDKRQIIKIIENFEGIVAIDEAYIDFAPEKSLLPLLDQYANLVVLQTFSKAWGLANLRLGIAFASKEIITVLNKVKPPYNINGYSQKQAIEAIKNHVQKDAYISNILAERTFLISGLQKMACVKTIYPSDANFLLVKVTDAKAIYHFLISRKIIVRDRSSVMLCEDCLRITVGTRAENEALLEVMETYSV